MSMAASADPTAESDPAAGALGLRLVVSGDAVMRVEIAPRAQLDPVRLLAQRTPAQAGQLLGTLYAVCGRTQALTGLTACEAALGQEAAAPQQAARRLLVLGEIAREHARRLLLDWPAELALDPDPAGVRAVAGIDSALANAVYPHGDWAQPGGGALRPDGAALWRAIDRLETALARHLEIERDPTVSLVALTDWAHTRPGPAAATLAALAADAPGFGALAAPAAAGHAPGDRAAHADAPACHPLARQRDTGAVAGAIARHGCGLYARVAAQFTELLRLPAAMRAAAAELAADPGGTQAARRDGRAAATTASARGALHHWVRLSGGRIADYRIDAPTDATFAPDGPVADALLGAAATDRAALRRRVRRFVLACDPCAPFTVELQEGGRHA